MTTTDYQPKYTIRDLEEALTDVLDGQDEHDIKGWTGLSIERCEELKELCNEVMANLHYDKYA